MSDLEYPNLKIFAKGYLHQDVLAEHGSLTAAAIQYRRDASPLEASKVAAELEKLCALHHALPDLNQAFRALGSQYRFSGWDEVKHLKLLLARTSIER